jgi:TonB family protein
VFPDLENNSESAPGLDQSISECLRAGKYDALFPAAERVSDVYRAATSTANNLSPTVTLRSSVPLAPDLFVAPEYPPLARLARVQGNVSLQIDLDENGNAINPVLLAGHLMLRDAVLNAIDGWKFPTDHPHQAIRLVLDFDLNCRRSAKSD